MRTALLVVFIVAGLSPAAHAERDYPCVVGGGLGASADCMYQTRQQCLASASGRWNTSCVRNARVAPPRMR
jgi:hypothetical protein